jgi:glutamate racemase
MNNKPILFLDSGIGGLPYFKHISFENPDEHFIYVADRKNFPYGPKSKEFLVDVLKLLMNDLVSLYDPKVIVIACNTASVTALEILRKDFPQLPFIGTVPAVKPAALETRTQIIGVLGSERTVEDPYIEKLASESGKNIEIKKIAAPELVDFVEHQYASASIDEKQNIVSSYIDAFRSAGADGLVLACTHFLFLLDEFRKAARPDITIYDSIEGVGKRFSSILNDQNLRISKKNIEKNILLITGNNDAESIWKQRALMYNMELQILDRLQQEKGNA